MRRPIVLLLLALGACGGSSGDTADGEGWPNDGFLQYLPIDTAVTVRLPALDDVKTRPEVYDALRRLLGREDTDPRALFYGVAEPTGLAPATAAGIAWTASGARVRFLPAADKASLNAALRTGLPGASLREEGKWILVLGEGAGAGIQPDEPLPPGDLAVRARFWPIVDALAQRGDTIEAGVVLGTAGLEFSGRLLPAEMSETREAVTAAVAAEGRLLDYIPSGLFLRVETTLPATAFATFLTRAVAQHCGIKEESDRVLLERLLREACTAVDPARGLAFGLEARDGAVSAVALGRIAEGPDSPILAKLTSGGPPSFGGIVFHHRETHGGVGLSVHVVEAEPKLEGLPESAWGLVAAAADEPGLFVTFVRKDDWFVLSLGPRADVLCADVYRRIREGTSRSFGSTVLGNLRDQRADAYVLGVVFTGSGLDGLAKADRTALAASFGATADASAPEIAAAAAFRNPDGSLDLEGRVQY